MHARNAPRPSDYIRRNFYAGTMGFNLPMLTAAAIVFGSGRLMFGSDYGPVPISPAEHIGLVSQLNLTAPQREDIFWRTASEQSGLSPDTAPAAQAKPPSYGNVCAPRRYRVRVSGPGRGPRDCRAHRPAADLARMTSGTSASLRQAPNG